MNLKVGFSKVGDIFTWAIAFFYWKTLGILVLGDDSEVCLHVLLVFSPSLSGFGSF